MEVLHLPVNLTLIAIPVCYPTSPSFHISLASCLIGFCT